MDFVFFNGVFVKRSEAHLSIDDRGFLFGDGIFTTLHLDNGAVEFFEAHRERLLCQCLKMRIHTPEISLDLIGELARLNQASQGRWRVKMIVTGGEGDFLDLRERRGVLLITMRPYHPPVSPLCLKVIHYQPSGLLSEMKTLSFYERLILKQRALENGYDDLLTVDAKGRIGEAAFANILFVRERQAWIPAHYGNCLNGIMIQFIRGLLRDEGYDVEEGEMTLEEIPDASAFLCNSLMRICPVSSIEERSFAVSEELQRQLEALVAAAIRAKAEK